MPKDRNKKRESNKRLYGNNSRMFQGEAQPLSDMARMGDKARKSKPTRPPRAKDQGQGNDIGWFKMGKAAEEFDGMDLDDVVYRPQTQESRVAYRELLDLVKRRFDTVSHSTIKGCYFALFYFGGRKEEREVEGNGARGRQGGRLDNGHVIIDLVYVYVYI